MCVLYAFRPFVIYSVLSLCMCLFVSDVFSSCVIYFVCSVFLYVFISLFLYFVISRFRPFWLLLFYFISY